MTAADTPAPDKPAPNVAELWTNLQGSVQALSEARATAIFAKDAEDVARGIEKLDRQAFNAAVDAERPKRPRKAKAGET